MLKTKQEAANHLGVNLRTIQAWVQKGLIGPPPWVEADLEAFHATRRQRSAVAVARAGVEQGEAETPLTTEVKTRIRQRYSDWLGQPATINQLCAELGITRKQFMAFKAEDTFVHASEPFTVAEMESEPEEDLAADALDMARSSLAHKFAKARYRDMLDAAGKWHAFVSHAERVAVDLAERLPSLVAEVAAPLCRAQGVVGNGYCLVLYPTDLHYGKRGAALIGPGAYDRATARARLFSAFEHVWSLLPCVPEAVVLFTGSDGCHIDSAKGTTTKGTPQDLDGNTYEIATEYAALMYDAAEWVRRRGPRLEVRVCPGNHDKFVSRIVHASMLKTYEADPSVSVHPSMAEYQCFEWGHHAVMTTHGDGRSSTTDLAQVFATHFPAAWGRSKWRTVMRGNLHHVRSEEGGGIRNELLPSCSGADEYHAIKWPVAGRPAFRAPLLHRSQGGVVWYEWVADE